MSAIHELQPQNRYSQQQKHNIYDTTFQINPELRDYAEKDQKIHVSMMIKPRKPNIPYTISNSKTKTQMRTQLPQIGTHSHLLQTKQKKVKQEHKSIMDIFKNKNLKYLFTQYCKQSYIGGAQGTFDNISQSGQKMTLNKWMVFLKQFQLVKNHSKLANQSRTYNLLSKIQATQCFKQATNYTTYMYLQQFLDAIHLIKIKLNLDQQFLLTNIFHADSHLATRNRLACLRVNFAGPKKNFFIEGTLTQGQRRQQKLKQIQFQEKQRKRLANMTGKQYIPIKGMSQQHYMRQINERKKKREDRSRRLQNKNHLNPIDSSQNHRNTGTKSYRTDKPTFRPYSNSKRERFNSYSQVYYTQKQRKQYESQQNSKNKFINNSYIVESRARVQHQDIINKNSSHTNYINDIANQPIQQQFDKSRIKNWQQQLGINSDAQSDQILRDHYMNEKKFKDHLAKISKGRSQIKNKKRDTQTYLKIKNTDHVHRPNTDLYGQKSKTYNIFQPIQQIQKVQKISIKEQISLKKQQEKDDQNPVQIVTQIKKYNEQEPLNNYSKMAVQKQRQQQEDKLTEYDQSEKQQPIQNITKKVHKNSQRTQPIHKTVTKSIEKQEKKSELKNKKQENKRSKIQTHRIVLPEQQPKKSGKITNKVLDG